MKKTVLASLVCLTALCTGCAHVYRVSVDSINAGQEVTNKTYTIVPGNTNTETDDLQFKEFVMYVGRALKTRGYTEADVKQTPDIEIYLSYGIGNPESRVRTYTVPVWGETNTEVTTNEETVKTDKVTSTTTTTNITPEYGVTGYARQEENITVYPKYIEIDAYNTRNTKPGARLEELWKTTIRSEGKKNELRHVFPILIAAASKYLGGNTGQEIEIDLTENHEEVKTIKGIKE